MGRYGTFRETSRNVPHSRGRHVCHHRRRRNLGHLALGDIEICAPAAIAAAPQIVFAMDRGSSPGDVSKSVSPICPEVSNSERISAAPTRLSSP